MPGLHPLVVHFPLGLGIGGALALAASRLARNERVAAALAVAGTWNLIAAAAAALLAIATGVAAIVGLHAPPAVHQAVAVHVKWAMLSSMMLVLLAVWRGAGNAHDERPSRAMVVALLAVAAAIAVTGYRGALNVYRYGVGVAARGVAAPAGARAAGAPAAGPAARPPVADPPPAGG